MKRFVAFLLGLLLVSAVPIVSWAQPGPAPGADRTQTMRNILTTTRQPAAVARLLAVGGAQFKGYQQRRITFINQGGAVLPASDRTISVDAALATTVTDRQLATPQQVRLAAGDKVDFTMTFWLYEWRNSSGIFTEQAVVNGTWSRTEWGWIDAPTDVIDIRWIVGDLVYLSSTPFDGVLRDQHTQGIASYTVDDQVKSWDLYVNFRPVSGSVYGKWSNIFVNYTHTWLGLKLGISLSGGPNGNTGTININTDAKTWTEGTGLGFAIGSGEDRGPAKTGTPPQER